MKNKNLQSMVYNNFYIDSVKRIKKQYSKMEKQDDNESIDVFITSLIVVFSSLLGEVIALKVSIMPKNKRLLFIEDVLSTIKKRALEENKNYFDIINGGKS